MASFPTLQRRGTETHNPVVGAMDSQMAYDPVVRSQSEGGYAKTRARYTRIARQWTVHYDWLTKTNKNTIKTFEDARVAGSESFTWTNPEDSAEYTVRFVGLVRYIPHEHTNFLWWMVEFMLEQV